MSHLSNAVELSEREIECMHWTCEGKTSGEIAVILGISDVTVSQYCGQAMRKLGAVNRTQAAVIFDRTRRPR